MVRRKTRRNLKNLVVMAGGSALMGITGHAMPGTTGAALTGASASMSGFVGPMATATGAGMVLDVLPKPQRRRQRRR